MKRRRGQNSPKTSRPTTPELGSLAMLPKIRWPNFTISQIRVLLVVLSAICFGNSLNGHFVFDDAETIVGNPDVQGSNPWWAVFQHDYWGTDITANHSHKSYRPLTTITFRLNALVSDNVFGYHVVNLLLHVFVCQLVMEVYRTLIERVLHIYDTRLLLLASVYFTTHAVHTEVVSNITGRAELLSALFYLASFLLHNRWMNPDRDGCQYFGVLSVFSACVGVLCKEQAITVLAINIVYDSVVTLRSIDWLKMRSAANRREADKMNNNHTLETCDQVPLLRQYILRCTTVLLSTVILCTVRLYIMQFAAPTFTAYDNPASFMSSVLFRTINYNYIYVLNVWLLVNPSDLCFDYSMGCVPLIQSFDDPRLIVVLLFWTSLLVIAYTVVTTHRLVTSHKWFIALCGAFIIIPFIPSSNLLFKVGFVLAERVLYLPSVGFCLIMAYAVHHIFEIVNDNPNLGRIFNQHSLLAAVLAALAANSGKCILRNREWQNELSLYQSALTVCPNNAKVHYNLAKVLADQGAEQTAEMKYRHALSLNPHYEQAMNNLANVLEKKGEYEEAAVLLRKAIRIRPDFATAWMNLGIVLAAQGHSSQSEAAYHSALRLRPFYADCHYNLANLYLATGKPFLALNSWQNATDIDLKHRKSWINRLILLDELDDCVSVVHLAETALTAIPEEPSILATFGSCLAKLGRFSESERELLKVLKLSPQDANSWGNLGVLYHRWKRLGEAESYYRKALKLDSGLKLVRSNLEMMLKSRQ